MSPQHLKILADLLILLSITIAFITFIPSLFGIWRNNPQREYQWLLKGSLITIGLVIIVICLYGFLFLPIPPIHDHTTPQP